LAGTTTRRAYRPTDGCVTSHTPTSSPCADTFADALIGMLPGGYGSAAKSADEVGRMGAAMLRAPSWTYDLAAERLRSRLQWMNWISVYFYGSNFCIIARVAGKYRSRLDQRSDVG
jgi:hypothetical protein